MQLLDVSLHPCGKCLLQLFKKKHKYTTNYKRAKNNQIEE